MKHLLIALYSLVTLATPVAAFVVDIGEDVLRRLDGTQYLSDVTIGEPVMLQWAPMCLRDGKLFIAADSTLMPKDQTPHGIRFFATRLTADSVVLQTHETLDTSPKDIIRMAQKLGPRTCDAWAETADGRSFFRVASINGAISLTDLFNKPPFVGIVDN